MLELEHMEIAERQSSSSDDLQVEEQPQTSQSEENTKFPVYFVHSPKKLSDIEEFLKKFGDVGYLRILYERNGSETADKNIAILSDETYEKICEKGYNKRQYGIHYIVTPFKLPPHCQPPNGQSKVLFVPVPEQLSFDDEFVTEVITEKLSHLVDWKILPDKSWYLKVPLVSRETGGVKGGCFINFKSTVPFDTIAMVRVLLSDTIWQRKNEDNFDADDHVIKCFWARERDYQKDTKGRTPAIAKYDKNFETSTINIGKQEKSAADNTQNWKSKSTNRNSKQKGPNKYARKLDNGKWKQPGPK